MLTKILANWIQQYIKKIIHHDQVELTSGIEKWSNICKSISVIHHINKWRIKLMITSIDTEKATEKLQHLWWKTLSKVSTEEAYPNIIQIIYAKPIANIRFNGEKLTAFPLRLGTQQGCTLLTLLLNVVLEVLATSNQARKGIQLRKKEVKLSLFEHDMILYTKSSKVSTKKKKE